MREKGIFKGILTLAMCTLLGLGTGFPVSANEGNTNTDISQQCGYTLKSNGNFLKKICDSNIYTNTTFNTGDTIVIYCDSQTIESVYMVTDSPIGTYTVSSGGTDQTCGENGFIHDYTKITTPSNTVEITILEDNVSVDEVYVFTSGQLPDWVQIWAPPVERADMLLLPTNQDDEFLFFGGTIPYYAGERGLSVQVAFMTNNQGETNRTHEALNALWAGGIKNYPVMGEFQDKNVDTLDAAKASYDVNKLEEFQVNMLRRFKPQIVIGHDTNGEDGNGTNMLNAETLKTSLEDAKDNAKFPDSAGQYGVWDVPKTYLHLYGENQVNMDWSVALTKFGGKSAYDVAVDAFNNYKSQQQNAYVHQEQDGTAYDNHLFGLYRTNVGADTGLNDFMENIIAYAEQPAQTEPVQTEVADSNGDTVAVNGEVSTVTTLVPQNNVSVGSKVGFWICMVVCLVAVVIMWVVCVQMAKEKKEQEKKIQQAAMRKKQQGQKKKRPISQDTGEIKTERNKITKETESNENLEQ